MKFDEAIIELIESHPSPYGTGKVIAENLADAMGMVLVEKPTPPERKIDHPTLKGWSISAYDRHVCDEDGCDVNRRGRYTLRDMCSSVIVVAPDMMQEAILLVNAGSSCDRKWLDNLICRLRTYIIDANFGCDLD